MLKPLATGGLAELHAATKHYRYDVSGLVADPALLSYVEKYLETHKPAPQVSDEDYFARIRSGEGRYTAARSLGIDPVLILRRLRTDEDFVDRLKVAEFEASEPAYMQLRDAANNGEKWAVTMLLQSKNSEEFAAAPKSQVNVQINNGHVTNTDDPIDAEILALESDLIQKRDLQLGSGNE